jgi:hypothetical protein
MAKSDGTQDSLFYPALSIQYLTAYGTNININDLIIFPRFVRVSWYKVTNPGRPMPAMGNFSSYYLKIFMIFILPTAILSSNILIWQTFHSFFGLY